MYRIRSPLINEFTLSRKVGDLILTKATSIRLLLSPLNDATAQIIHPALS